MNLHHFESFDLYAAAIFDADARIFLLGPKAGGWRLGHVDVSGIHVQLGVTMVPNLCEAVGWPTHLTLFLPQPSSGDAWFNGAPFDQESLGIVAPGKEFVFRAAGPNEWISIALPVSAGLFADNGLVAHTLRQWARVAGVVRTGRHQVDALREAAIMSTDPSCPPAIGRRLIERRFCDLIATWIPPAKGKGRPSLSLPLLCESALKILRKPQQAAHLGDLHKRLKISERSLRDAFKACFGMSPGHYACLRKLHDIYLDLAKEGDRGTTVADCFLRHGYPYSTYAAARYQALFLESPSQTRRRFISNAAPA